MAYLSGQGLNNFINFDGNPAAWQSYGHQNAYPHSVLFDRDGNIRRIAVGAIDGAPRNTQWDTAISELTGVAPLL